MTGRERGESVCVCARIREIHSKCTFIPTYNRNSVLECIREREREREREIMCMKVLVL